jgi:hypothetical protein
MASDTGRPLTPGEIALAMPLFGGSFDFDRVRIHQHKYFLFHGANNTMTPNGEMYFHPESGHYCEDFSDPGERPDRYESLAHLFIHELTHAWQHQHGTSMLVKGLFIHMFHQPGVILNRWFGREFYNAYAYELMPDRRFSSYNIEQQAEIVADSFSLKTFGWVGGHCRNAVTPSLEEYDSVLRTHGLQPNLI